jgi:hypothetical protein
MVHSELHQLLLVLLDELTALTAEQQALDAQRSDFRRRLLGYLGRLQVLAPDIWARLQDVVPVLVAEMDET